MRRCVLAVLLVVAGVGCNLDERNDFQVGRACNSNDECDSTDQCLPHEWISESRELRCRSAVSFQRTAENREPPLAYCDEGDHPMKPNYFCPEGTVCRADRVRPLDGSVRREVCQLPESPFGPPP